MSETFTKSEPKHLPFSLAQQDLFDTWKVDAEKLAKSFYRRYEANRVNYDIEDMISMAYLALIKAVRGFNPSLKTASFFTYFIEIFKRDIYREHVVRNQKNRRCPVAVLSLDAEIQGFVNGKHHARAAFAAIIPDRKAHLAYHLVDVMDEFEHITSLGEKFADHGIRQGWQMAIDHVANEIPQAAMVPGSGVSKSRVSTMIRDAIGRVRERAMVEN